jgi:hypothetical protein
MEVDGPVGGGRPVRLLGMDCEMVTTEHGLELARCVETQEGHRAGDMVTCVPAGCHSCWCLSVCVSLPAL